jgi:hypothetical protein
MRVIIFAKKNTDVTEIDEFEKLTKNPRAFWLGDS